jgi:hypothetical protein
LVKQSSALRRASTTASEPIPRRAIFVTQPRQVCPRPSGSRIICASSSIGHWAERSPPRNARSSQDGKRIGFVSQFMASSASPMKLLRARRPSRARSPRANISSDPRCSLIFVHDVLEAQQKATDRNSLMPFYNLNIDAGALWARRKIDSLLRSEQGQRLRLG